MMETRPGINHVQSLNPQSNYLHTAHVTCTAIFAFFKMLFRQPSTPPIDVSGIYAQKHLGIEVTFHVLLPVELWEYDMQKSQVYVCFGHLKMGKWQPVTVLKCVG